jgi:hypothetical protein
MHTPLKKTFDNPEYLARSRKYDHKCACDICTCGKVLLTQANIAVLSQDPSSRGKPPIATSTRHIRCSHSTGRSSRNPTCRPITTPTLSSPATRRPTLHIRCTRKNQLCKKAPTRLPRHPSKVKVSTRKAISPIKQKQNALIPLRARNMCPIPRDSKTRPHTSESFLPRRSKTPLKPSGRLITTSQTPLLSRGKQATRHHSRHTRSSQSGRRLVT